MSSTLYLIPTTLGDVSLAYCIPSQVVEITQSLRHFIVEDIRTARRQLAKLKMPVPIDELSFYELNEHTKPEELHAIMQPLLNGEAVGLMSEAGVPSVADPGKAIVAIAHQKNIKVVPLVGPSSILLALMASGLNGQNFAFNGYLPVKDHERAQRIRVLEKHSVLERQSQIFIEAPYRNNKLLEAFLTTCNDTTMLCIAVNLTLENEWIQTQAVSYWKKHKPDINKKPCIFIMQG